MLLLEHQPGEALAEPRPASLSGPAQELLTYLVRYERMLTREPHWQLILVVRSPYDLPTQAQYNDLGPRLAVGSRAAEELVTRGYLAPRPHLLPLAIYQATEAGEALIRA